MYINIISREKNIHLFNTRDYLQTSGWVYLYYQAPLKTWIFSRKIHQHAIPFVKLYAQWRLFYFAFVRKKYNPLYEICDGLKIIKGFYKQQIRRRFLLIVYYQIYKTMFNANVWTYTLVISKCVPFYITICIYIIHIRLECDPQHITNMIPRKRNANHIYPKHTAARGHTHAPRCLALCRRFTHKQPRPHSYIPYWYIAGTPNKWVRLKSQCNIKLRLHDDTRRRAANWL